MQADSAASGLEFVTTCIAECESVESGQEANRPGDATNAPGHDTEGGSSMPDKRTTSWPFAQPFEWYRDRTIAMHRGEIEWDQDEFDALVNTCNFNTGVPSYGHRCTFDFFVARRSIARLKGFHRPTKAVA